MSDTVEESHEVFWEIHDWLTKSFADQGGALGNEPFASLDSFPLNNDLTLPQPNFFNQNQQHTTVVDTPSPQTSLSPQPTSMATNSISIISGSCSGCAVLAARIAHIEEFLSQNLNYVTLLQQQQLQLQHHATQLKQAPFPPSTNTLSNSTPTSSLTDFSNSPALSLSATTSPPQQQQPAFQHFQPFEQQQPLQLPPFPPNNPQPPTQIAKPPPPTTTTTTTPNPSQPTASSTPNTTKPPSGGIEVRLLEIGHGISATEANAWAKSDYVRQLRNPSKALNNVFEVTKNKSVTIDVVCKAFSFHLHNPSVEFAVFDGAFNPVDASTVLTQQVARIPLTPELSTTTQQQQQQFPISYIATVHVRFSTISTSHHGLFFLVPEVFFTKQQTAGNTEQICVRGDFVYPLRVFSRERAAKRPISECDLRDRLESVQFVGPERAQRFAGFGFQTIEQLADFPLPGDPVSDSTQKFEEFASVLCKQRGMTKETLTQMVHTARTKKQKRAEELHLAQSQLDRFAMPINMPFDMDQFKPRGFGTSSEEAPPISELPTSTTAPQNPADYISAIHAGDVETLRVMLEGMDIRQRDLSAPTPLMMACLLQKTEVVEFVCNEFPESILQMGANKMTAMHVCAIVGRVDYAKQMFQRFPIVASLEQENGLTPLMCAVISKQEKFVQEFASNAAFTNPVVVGTNLSPRATEEHVKQSKIRLLHLARASPNQVLRTCVESALPEPTQD